MGDLQFGTLERILAALAWVTVVGFYFVLFWATAGRTPGMRLMALRVLGPTGGHPGIWRSLLRLIALGLCIIPLFAGFLPVLVDDRRRGLHDFLAGTVVIYDLEDVARR
ncbi:MAG TPA: RDD family protein [Candidatus Limnocylindrales bacterium]